MDLQSRHSERPSQAATCEGPADLDWHTRAVQAQVGPAQPHTAGLEPVLPTCTRRKASI
jgi:hypothetical protein